MPLKHFPPFHILFLTKSHFINILSILFYFINPSQEYNQTQPNPHGSGYVGLNSWVGNFFLLITIIIKLNRKNISHVPLELTNKIYINSYSNSVINKIYPIELINKTYINQYFNSVINKLEWSGSMGVGGNRKRNKIVTVYEIIEFYIGRAE